MGDLAVDDWEQLAEELVQETAGDQFGGIDNHFGGMRKAPSQVETKRICVWVLLLSRTLSLSTWLTAVNSQLVTYCHRTRDR